VSRTQELWDHAIRAWREVPFIKVGAALTLLGNTGIFTVFGQRIWDRFREVSGGSGAPRLIGRDGRPIPLDAASAAAIQAALSAHEQRQKS
jgi:hypothetical protein